MQIGMFNTDINYNDRVNCLTGNVLSDEWYTPKYLVNKCISLTDLSGKKILLPYDTEKSIFTTVLKENGYDITYGINDFLDKEYAYDILITNPPFSFKEQIFERCLEEKKDFILVLPETFVFSVGFYDLMTKYKFNYRLFSPKQRVYFIDKDGNQNRPNFHTIIIWVSKDFNENTIEHFYSEVI